MLLGSLSAGVLSRGATNDAWKNKIATICEFVAHELSSREMVSHVRGDEASFAIQINANHDGLNDFQIWRDVPDDCPISVAEPVICIRNTVPFEEGFDNLRSRANVELGIDQFLNSV